MKRKRRSHVAADRVRDAGAVRARASRREGPESRTSDSSDRTRAVSVARLKASLSKYLARVKAGEEVIITERGRPIARVVPIRLAEWEEGLAELIREGIVRPADPNAPEAWREPAPIHDPDGLVLKALLEEREEGY